MNTFSPLILLTAPAIYENFPPVPVVKQPTCQRKGVPRSQETVWQHICFPVSKAGSG